ncbi:MAG: right-handed parallel beta-helix repeat-containing protein, partial [Anaerolineae bacterium]|nr:right-handed parallel beta-helix repeat-containing protein [Anaerolineae bacterium]
MKRLTMICILGLGLLAYTVIFPDRVGAAPQIPQSCTFPATVTTAAELADCITTANTNGAGLDTITLGANITLSATLPQITTAIVVEGAGYFIDGADTYRVFYVGSTGNLTINQATLQNGYSGSNGGAIENLGVLTVNRSTLSSNTANFAGGGISNAGTLTIIHSTISGNTTNITGGGGISNSGPLTVTNSTFSGNTAAGSGGAISNYETPLTVTNSTFSGNSASSGGAIYGYYANSIINLAGNIFVAGANGANCANNLGTLTDNGYNLSDDATCTNGGFGSQTNATLNLGALAANGGLTPTHLPGAGSAAIGAIPFGYVGDNNGVLMACNQTTTDQIGQSRPLTTNITCTSGAVEATSTSLTIIKDASPAIGADFDFTINSAPLTSYSNTTTGKPFWTRPNEGATCTLSTNSVRYHVQAFVVDTSGSYGLSSQQSGWNGYIHLYQDSFNPLAPCANYITGDDDALSSSSSEIISFLEAGRTYFFVTSGKFSTAAGNFTNYVVGPGNAYTLYESFTLDDAVPDDSDGVNASATFAVTPGTYAVTEAGLSGWGLTGATCTGAGGSFSLTGDTLSVQVSNGEAVQCTFTNETLCPASGTVTTAAELSACILLANANESPSPTADIITLGADITLTTALPQITSEIMLDGANQFIDGGDSVQLFTVVSGGAFTVNQATLQNGYASYGGSINNNGGTLTVTNSTISGNYAAVFGGGIYNIWGTLTVTNSTFSGNEARWSGGGVYNIAGTVNVLNSTILGNSVTSGDSGGIRNDGTLNVTDSTISGNSAADSGGGILNTGTATVTNSTISGNTATYEGGGIFNTGTATVTNSTISGNSAAILGGGIFNDSTLTVSNSTFSGNSTPGSGGGVYNNGMVYLAGTIFADSTNGNCTGGATLTDNGYNLSDDASCGFSGTGSADNATLNLGALTDNGGPTQTHLPGPASDAIGAIPNGTTISNNGASWTCDQSSTDQRGESRPINSGDACTAGAVEVTPICTAWTVTTADELADCITLANANESPGPTADTITLGANITLTTALPQITSAITLDGANHFIDGDQNVQLFYVDVGGDFTVNQATLQNGLSEEGGGISNRGTLTVSNSTFSGNFAINDDGGGINNTGTLMVSNSTFSGNQANNNGGGINSSGTLMVTNSTFSGNRAIFGGGIANGASTATVTNSTFSGNRAEWPVGDGGGIYNRGTLTVTNSTFSGNFANNNGGGVYNWSGGTAHLAGTIFAVGSNGANCTNLGTLTDNGYNLSDDGSCGFSGTGSANNATLNLSGLSVTTTPGQQVHTPNEPSDAIGVIPYGTTINNNGVTLACNQTTTDQLGVNRPITAFTACTAGAVEVELPPLCPSWTVTTAAELADCITLANYNESPSPTADTITLGADIMLSAALPQITSVITLEGAGYVVDGDNSVRLFYVNSGGDFTVNQTTLQNGSAEFGGGIYNDNGTLTVTNSTFSNNTAIDNGGAISSGAYSATLAVSNSTFTNNSAVFGGAIAQIADDTISVTTISNSTFSGNSATYGGAIYKYYGVVTVSNSTFSGNSAPNTGGIYAGTYHGTMTVSNSTFSGNLGGSIRDWGPYLAGNLFDAGATGDNCIIIDAIADNGYNLSDDASCGFSGTGSANNATLNLSGLSVTPTPGQQVHTPTDPSDAIGAIPYGTTINNNGVTLACNQTTTDQLGADRPITALTACTAGAVEVVMPLCPSWAITTADQLYKCITEANANGAGPDTIILEVNIDLTTLTISPLPPITSAITLDGANHFIDGGNSVRIFYVNSGGDFTVNQVALQNGSAIDGGGIYNDGTLTVTDSIFSGNSATYWGGGILNDGTLTVTTSTFSGNTANYGGGILNFDTLTVTTSTFSGNSATTNGGGILNDSDSTLTVVNSTISGNSATNGGGILNGGALMVTSGTFSGNTGGGIFHIVGTVHLAGTIFADSTSGNNCNGSGTITDNGYNLSDDASCGFSGSGSANNATLNLADLADNG